MATERQDRTVLKKLIEEKVGGMTKEEASEFLSRNMQTLDKDWKHEIMGRMLSSDLKEKGRKPFFMGALITEMLDYWLALGNEEIQITRKNEQMP